ncbi:hypothetical protein DL770_005375 [Monosporascus sp. CRB-9-2]|nr:hypothetical protein DL770_005375 [Monosporascus sp. CRB-9-2]
MADNFSYNELKDRTLILNAKILTPPGHNPHPNSRIDFDTQKETNVARAFALGNLQKTRTTVVDKETLRRSLLDTMGTYSADLRTRVMAYHFQDLDGLFSTKHDFQRRTFPVWGQVRKILGDDGVNQYHALFSGMRKRLYTFMVVPIDQVWVLIVVQIRHDPDKPAPVADGEQLVAARVVIYDVVEAGQALREQIIRDRMRRVLQEGDINLPVGGIEVMYDLPMVEAYHSGLIIHEIATRLMERLDAEVARVRRQNPAATADDIHAAMHAANPPSVFRAVFMDTRTRIVDRTRSRMIGSLLTGASLENSWKAIAAIELPGQSSKNNDYNPNDMVEPVSQRGPTPVVIDLDTPDTSMEMDSDEHGDDNGGDDDVEMVDLTGAARGITL